ncbi:MAG: serine/threonine-protein kinase [Ferruginibacter sp.]
MRYDNGHIKEIAGYHLAERIGSGGMGDVYIAYNAALNRTAAVKILHQKEMAERFKNEAYIQSSVSHPNIACLYEYVISGDTPCIIMEYVDGETLDTYLHKRGKLSNPETENIVRQVASALAYLHKKDILHRDIKPQNFKIRPNGTVTMLDFGIAKNKYTPKLTQLGFVVGTTEYMAPEQFQQQVEKKSDVWSLGVLTYELITGYLPFEANNPVTLRSKIEKGSFTDPKIMVPQVSEKLKSVIEKSLRQNPSSRISASEVESLLFNKQQTGHVREVKQNRVKSNFSRKTLLISGAAALLLIIVLIFIATGPDEKNIVINTDEPVTQGKKSEPTGLEKLIISVPNAPNAYIVFPDGSTKQLPYEISGRDGEYFQFTLQAEGYVSRKEEVPITNRRKSYEYNLEKIKK